MATEEKTTEELLIDVYQSLCKNSKPLSEEFAQILSDNILDLF